MRPSSLQAAGRVRAVALDFTLPPDLRDLIDRVRAYVEEEALPAEAEIADPADLIASWDVVERLRERARERGLFTPHLPEEWGGLGTGPLGMALISQECGVSGLASLGLNAMAPDEGNMHTLLIAGTREQLETYLRPLAEGRVRSCFAMTEPDVAEAFGRIADRAVQMHGAAGIAMDLPIARIFQDARAARIYDGASEVHRMVVARDMLKLAAGGESVRAASGEL